MTMEEISIDEFMKIDLRVAKIKNVKTVEGADKLIQLDLDLGNLGEKTVFAGIKNSYNCRAAGSYVWTLFQSSRGSVVSRSR